MDIEDESSVLYRPLFEELNDSHYRESAFGGPYGVLIGGMAHPSLYCLSDQYRAAADLMVECIKNQDVEDFTLANPILFLYRHSIEMLLKSLLFPRQKGHDLRRLLTAFCSHVRHEYGCEVPAWISARIEEIATIDPASTAFRYAETGGARVDGEIHVYLEPLGTVVRSLHSALNDAPDFRPDLPVPWTPDLE